MSTYLYLSFVFIILIACSGCATIEKAKYVPQKDYEKRLERAVQERKTFLRLLTHAQSVDDTVKAKDCLDRVQRQIEELEAEQKVQRDLDDGFESTKKRTVIHGPVGWILIGSKWILEKLYILYPWNWRAF